MQALIYRGSDFEIHTARRSLNVNGSDIDCEPRVFDLIVYLIEQRERAVDKQELITRLWNGRPVSDASLSQLVYKARKALADDGATRACIQTMHGRGFRWVAAVTASVPAEPSPTAAANPAEPADAAVEPRFMIEVEWQQRSSAASILARNPAPRMLQRRRSPRVRCRPRLRRRPARSRERTGVRCSGPPPCWS